MTGFDVTNMVDNCEKRVGVLMGNVWKIFYKYVVRYFDVLDFSIKVNDQNVDKSKWKLETRMKMLFSAWPRDLDFINKYKK